MQARNAEKETNSTKEIGRVKCDHVAKINEEDNQSRKRHCG